jgi:hypothetical protein
MRDALRRGARVIVGGHSRGVGKTLFIEDWLRAHRGEPWIAVKVSAHRHAPDGVAVPLVEEGSSSDQTQTGRYLRAGAVRAFLVRAPAAALGQAAKFVASLACSRQQGGGSPSVIVESNRLVLHLDFDYRFFVVDPDIADWKASSADFIGAPHVIVCRRGRSRHDSHIVTSALGDGAALRTDSLHRLDLSRTVAERAARVNRAG